MEELIPSESYTTAQQLKTARDFWGDMATSIFIAGWATGGLFFGMLGDRIGRAKTMIFTILLYSLFTGLSSFSVGPLDFAIYRFLTGLGVGGEFAVGVALVSEVMPSHARPYTLGLLQALSAFGNVSAAVINLSLGVAQDEGLVESPWRIMFLIGAVPALLTIFIRRRLKEPERWQQISHEGAMQKQLGSYRELFGDPKLRRHAILGMLLGCSGVLGLWSVGFFTPDLMREVQRPTVAAEVLDDELRKAEGDEDLTELLNTIRPYTLEGATAPDLSEADKKVESRIGKRVSGRLAAWSSYTLIASQVGAFFGMFGFSALAQRIGRKKTFAIAFIAALLSTAAVFWFLKDIWQIWIMVPIMGFCQLSLFAGYAIYFPELFPTRLRSTGTSFCYNVGRFLAAFGPIVKTFITRGFLTDPDPSQAQKVEAMRHAGVTMCAVFLIGLIVLPFLPETKDQPLPE
jgi:MFS family permease